MIDYIRFYLTDNDLFVCSVSVNQNERRLYARDYMFIQQIIKKWKIYPSVTQDDYVEYKIEDFNEINREEQKKLMKICLQKYTVKNLNRELSGKIIPQKFKFSIVAGALAGMLSVLGLSNTSISMPCTDKSEKNVDSTISTIEEFNTKLDTVSIKLFDNLSKNVALDYAILEQHKNIAEEDFNIIPVWQNRICDIRYSNSLDYIDTFERYGNQYGIDPRLLAAIAAQESSGVHSSRSLNGAAIGLMQIEIKVWQNQKLTAYNFQTKEYETIQVDRESLGESDYNIKVAAMILQNCLVNFQYNIPISLQCYNMGSGNMRKVLKAYCNDVGIEIEDMIQNQVSLEWVSYLKKARGGDKHYIENVLSFLPDGTELLFTTPDYNTVNVIIDNVNCNDYVNDEDTSSMHHL